MTLSVVKLVNEYAGRFDELEERVREVRRVITKMIITKGMTNPIS